MITRILVIYTAGITALIFGFSTFAADMHVPLPKKKPIQSHYDKRCDTAARYEAMREAYEAGQPDPCQPRKQK